MTVLPPTERTQSACTLPCGSIPTVGWNAGDVEIVAMFPNKSVTEAL